MTVAGNNLFLVASAPAYGRELYKLVLAGGPPVPPPAGILTPLSAAGATLAPQPAHSTLTLTSADPALDGREAIVLDLQGREVTRFALAPAVVLDVRQWVPGLYMLRLPSGEVLRVVKQ